MILKEELDKIWNELPCQVPLKLCRWNWFGHIHQTLAHQLWKKIKKHA